MIPAGDATGASDISVRNRYFAISFGVDTASPWGVARGGILDLAIFNEGQLGRDVVSLIDFMPNYWSAWPSSYQNTAIVEQDSTRVIVRTQRDWGEVELITDYEISADSQFIDLRTRMTNSGKKMLTELTTGYIAWPNGGHLFGMPGITEGDSRPISQGPSLGNWSAVYDKDWAIGIFAPFADHVAYTGRDRYLKHSLNPGETREFSATIQIESSANLANFVKTEIQQSGAPHGLVSGTIGDTEGKAVPGSAAIIHQNGRLYAWSLERNGKFEFSLPSGSYEVFAVAPGYAPGPPEKSMYHPMAILYWNSRICWRRAK